MYTKFVATQNGNFLRLLRVVIDAQNFLANYFCGMWHNESPQLPRDCAAAAAAVLVFGVFGFPFHRYSLLLGRT